jgi:hypothetical protein
MGRLRTRGYVEDYYYHLIALFLVPTLVWVSASVMTRVFTKIPRFKSLCLGAVCLLLGVTSLRQAQIHHAANSKNLEQTWFKHEMLKQAVTYFKQSSGSCYAGTTSSIPDLGREMDLLLYRQSCSVRQGTPWVVKLTPDYERKTVELTYLAESILEDPDDNRTTAEVTLSSPQEVVEPNLFDSFPQKNRYQAPFLISAHPPISIQVSDKIYTPHRLTAKLEIKETDAPMLGFGIATGIGEKWESVVSLTLINNEIYLRKGSATNPLAEARGIIQDFSKNISITLMQSDQRCRVFYNHALVAELLDCTFSSGKIAFFTMDNKTPAEELLDLRAD